MNSFRRMELWAGLAVLGLLAVLSVVGAFLGADGGGAMFTSVPLAAFWAFFVLLLVAAVLTFPRLRRSPGLLAMHVGFALIVLGAFWGSQTGHRIAAALTGHSKLPPAYMALGEGEAGDRLTDAHFNQELGRLPFSIRAEHYPWMLIAEVPGPPGRPAEEGPYAQVRVDWKVGAATRVPLTDDTVTVLQYLPSARATFAEGAAATVEMVTAGGALKELPAKVGASMTLDDPKVTVRVVRLFANLRVIGSGEQIQVVDEPGPAQNPAVEVSVEQPDGSTQERFVTALMPSHGDDEDQLSFNYRAAEPAGAEEAPDGLPAMEVLVQRGERRVHGWLVASEGTMVDENGVHFVSLSLDGESAAQGTAPNLYLVEEVRREKSMLTVLEEGRPVLTRTVEANHPLSYGGYRFNLYAWSPQALALSVRSDSGLLLVYLGFAGAGVGAFWWMWFQPVWAYVARRRRAPNAG